MPELKPGAVITLRRTIERTILDEGQPMIAASRGDQVKLLERTPIGWSVKVLSPMGLAIEVTEDELS